ncbi:MAG: hypothetical protein NWR72_00255, partial [Bacteroidia bacterium]|nr:hypothetical protein [Bacteroidia bacterium]
MPLTLSNARLRLHLDLPHENYQRSRFDWSGKITQVFFQGIPLTAVETTAGEPGQFYGQGFYNEFGMDALPGFQEANIGDWCHKIGVGLVRKESETYLFHQDYDIRPATFEVKAEPERCEISCESELVNGYAYLLH